MLYIVECSYTDPQSEGEWNAFYSLEKLPALVSVNGFRTSQRFRAVNPGCPAYLALHTVKDAEVLSSDDYRRKGGGNFSRWQAYITDWHRNLYACEAPAPAVSSDEILLLSAQPISALATALGNPAMEMHAAGLERSPEHRVAWVLPRESALPLAEVPGVYLYEPLTSQLQCPVERHQQGSH
ncbi:sugar ABC transporter [Kosakonia radicincitans]|uniref:sugar ABC transporter n=1 Tax=Kosakonia radicincitans TaxID=283686 RepID=UPI000903185B|nr:sugar ABC transporter [Kosakonia radicincitans]APG16308.1 sugar ABC transporter [Kosakonia radicincitans]